VERIIQPGLTRLNWNSLGVEAYSRDCHQILKNLASLVTQMGQISGEVQAVIDSLEKFDFFHFEKSEQGPSGVSCTVNVRNVSAVLTLFIRYFMADVLCSYG
jgi:dynein heavy chain